MTIPPTVIMGDQPGEGPSPEACASRMTELIREGWVCFQQWICPACQKKVTSAEPNVVHVECYHDSPGCGFLYRGPVWRIFAIHGPPDLVRDLVERTDQDLPEFEGPLPGVRGARPSP